MSIETVKTVAWLWWDANATGIDTGGKHGRYKVSDLDIRAFAVVARSDYEAEHTRAEQLAAELEEASAEYLDTARQHADENVRLTDRAERAEAALRELVALKALKEEIDRLKQRRAVAFNRDPDEVARCVSMSNEYQSRKPAAWAAARAIVEGKP